MRCRHIDLFSGIGGFALAASRVWGRDHKLVTFCEIDDFCGRVLNKHWPNAPIKRDIKAFNEFYVDIDLLTGGFPCQPFSVAGRRQGVSDDRYLWPEMFRVIKCLRPTWVVGENVAGFVNVALDDCIFNLENEGYEVWPVIIPACAVGAPHRRDRVWIIANCDKFYGRTGTGRKDGEKVNYKNRIDSNSNSLRLQEPGAEQQTARNRQHVQANPYSASGKRNQGHETDSIEQIGQAREINNGIDRLINPNAIDQRLQRSKWAGTHDESSTAHGPVTELYPAWSTPWIEVATELCRVDDGLPAGMDGHKRQKSYRTERLKALGNAIVSQVAEEIFRNIKLLQEGKT